MSPRNVPRHVWDFLELFYIELLSNIYKHICKKRCSDANMLQKQLCLVFTEQHLSPRRIKHTINRTSGSYINRPFRGFLFLFLFGEWPRRPLRLGDLCVLRPELLQHHGGVSPIRMWMVQKMTSWGVPPPPRDRIHYGRDPGFDTKHGGVTSMMLAFRRFLNICSDSASSKSAFGLWRLFRCLWCAVDWLPAVLLVPKHAWRGLNTNMQDTIRIRI
jgi:hypothetical protein